MKRFCASLLLLSFLFTLPCALAAGKTEKPKSASPEKSRLPGPAVMTEEEKARILENGRIQRSAVLDRALSLLEEGNPFLERYNLITGAKITPPLPYGVPYLFGGRASSHVFSNKPDYVLQKAWQNSKYYRAGTLYFYGFDCVGYVRWVWEKTYKSNMKTVDQLLRDRSHQVFNSASKPLPEWNELASALVPGDIFIVRHPTTHMGLYVGTLRDYGYTAEEVPALAQWLDAPLVIHSHVDAAVSDHFAYLIKHGLKKYRIATVTDGGVSVSLLWSSASIAPYRVHQQDQTTSYFVLPDQSWLSVFGWKNIQQFCWYRK